LFTLLHQRLDRASVAETFGTSRAGLADWLEVIMR